MAIVRKALFIRSVPSRGRTAILSRALTFTILTLPYLYANGVPFQTGDVLAGVGNGQIKHFRPNGTLVDTLNTGAGSTEDTGMAFDASGNLYATVFQANNIYRFNSQGNLIGSFGSDFNRDPESIIFDKQGNAYVGQADGTGQVLKFSATGALIGSYSPQREDRGTDWIDLAADQCTLQYTSEGTSIKRFNVCTNSQLPDFATGLSGPCFANRIRPNGEVLVACTNHAYRFNSSGGIMQTYPITGAYLFALNLDPDNKTFWTASYTGGTVFHIDISTGALLAQFNPGILQTLAGLTIVGEITAATTVPPSTTSYYVTSQRSTTLFNMGRDLALSQVAAGVSQDTVVALLFGAPVFGQPRLPAGTYGASLWGHPTSVADIASLVEAFATGYYNSLGTNRNVHVRIIIATNSSGNQVTSQHGQTWAQMVNDVASWVLGKGYSGQIDIAGGNNIELGASPWATPLRTRSWVDGYASVFPQRLLYDVAAADGCPTTGTTATPRSCSNGWTQEDVWYVAWGAPPAEPLPEIYVTAQASQWSNLSHYSCLAHNGSMIIAGAMTELQACAQNPNDPTCKPQAFTPDQGWQQLYDRVNADIRTAQTLPWSTDIKWSSR